MDVIILGSGTLVPTSRRSAPGLVVIIKDKPILFDSGSGIIYKLPKAGIDYHKINQIFYTHYSHPDHINELPEIIFANKYDHPHRDMDLNIIGPHGIKSFYENIKRLFPILEELNFAVKIHEVNDEKTLFKDFSIISRPLSHGSVDCVGYRIESEGKAVVYTGDTDYCKELVELAKDADLLISECSFPNVLKVQGHLTPKIAGQIASEARVKKLLLTHLYPLCDDYDIKKEAEDIYRGEVIVAEDLMRIEV